MKRSVAVGCLIACGWVAFGSVAEAPLANRPYARLREQLRAFFPAGYCRSECQDPQKVESDRLIGEELDAWAAAHPGFDALDIRRESYLAMRRHFHPVLFGELPFYAECGINAGWAGCHPGRHVNRICKRFYKEKGLVPDEAFDLLNARRRAGLTVCCGPYVDDMHHVPPFRTLLAKGFSGVHAEVAEALAKCPADDPLGRKELETALVGLETMRELQFAFGRKAEAMLAAGGLDETAKKNMTRIAEAAKHCPWEPPKTFFEGLNALWFIREVLAYVDGLRNQALGHPDSWLIDLYRADLAAGRITPEEALDLISRFNVYADCHDAASSPVDDYDDQETEIQLTLGGVRPDGSVVWNELTRMFLDAHLDCDCVYPKVFCRFSSTSPQDYLVKIGDMIMKGHAVFTLLNDERQISNAVASGFSIEEARDYVGGGCWEGYVDSATDVDDCNYVSLMKILELTIYRDPKVEREAKIRFDPIDSAKSYEEVRDIVMQNALRFYRSLICHATRFGAANARIFPHPVFSMCLDGGIETRRDTTEGGVRYHPKVYTIGFLGNFVDSLAAIRQLCFVDRICTLPEFLDAVRSNWKGARGEELHKAVMASPYWGDNSKFTNDLAAWVIRTLHADFDGMVSEHCGPIVLNVYAYREFMYWGEKMRATPDGRFDGDRLAQGFSPSEYRCKADMTTVINAIGSAPHELLYQTNTNLTFDPSAMNAEIFAALFRTYAKKGAHEFQPNCTSVETLLDAQKHPERHRSLIIRVCGFSARFISLSRRWQDEVIMRHRLK